MSGAEATDQESGGGEGADVVAEAPPKRAKRVLLIVLAALVLLGGGVGAVWYFVLAAPPADKVADAPPEVFVDVPPIQVMLRTSDGDRRMLKVHVMLVPGSLTPEELTQRLPLVIDRVQPFLRELRPEDLSGSAATYRVKEELLIRANQALGPGSVREVLIQDLMQA